VTLAKRENGISGRKTLGTRSEYEGSTDEVSPCVWIGHILTGYGSGLKMKLAARDGAPAALGGMAESTPPRVKWGGRSRSSQCFRFFPSKES